MILLPGRVRPSGIPRGVEIRPRQGRTGAPTMTRKRDRGLRFHLDDGFPSWLSWLSGRSVERRILRVTYWHLTPRGWVRGGRGGGDHAGNGTGGPPEDRVITCAYVETSSEQEVHIVEIEDPEAAWKLMWRFGRCPWSHGDSPHPGVVSR